MSSDDEDSPPHRVIGPSLHPDEVAPAGGIGPAIPMELFKSRLAEQEPDSRPDQTFIPEDLDTIGPLIPGQELHDELRHLRSDGASSQSTSSRSQTDGTKLKRDTWMTELLPVSRGSAIALKPRKFNQGSGANPVEYDSSWFRNPNDGTGEGSQTLEELDRQERVKEITKSMDSTHNEKMSTEYSECQKDKTQKSLLDLHRKQQEREARKVAKKAKKEKHKKKHKKHRHRSPSPKEPTRKPFDREKDLKVSRLGVVARNALIERSKQLSSRFGHGSRQFL